MASNISEYGSIARQSDILNAMTGTGAALSSSYGSKNCLAITQRHFWWPEYEVFFSSPCSHLLQLYGVRILATKQYYATISMHEIFRANPQFTLPYAIRNSCVPSNVVIHVEAMGEQRVARSGGRSDSGAKSGENEDLLGSLNEVGYWRGEL